MDEETTDVVVSDTEITTEDSSPSTEDTSVETNPDEGVNNTEEALQNVPYDRFKEVNDSKKAAEARVEELERQIKELSTLSGSPVEEKRSSGKEASVTDLSPEIAEVLSELGDIQLEGWDADANRYASTMEKVILSRLMAVNSRLEQRNQQFKEQFDSSYAQALKTVGEENKDDFDSFAGELIDAGVRDLKKIAELYKKQAKSPKSEPRKKVASMVSNGKAKEPVSDRMDDTKLRTSSIKELFRQ